MSEKLNNHLVPDGAEAIVLDWDDTIVGTIKAKMRQHQHVAKLHYGIDLTHDEMAADWGKPLHELIKKWYRISPEVGDAQYTEVLATVLSYSGDFLKQPFEDAVETLGAFRESGYRLGVVTGSPRNDLHHDFEITGLTPEYFDYFQASDDSDYHKPDPRVFDPTNKWLKAESIEPSKVLYIGDSLRDGLPAIANGYHFLGVETGVASMPDFYRADMLSIRAIGDFLRRTGV